MKTICLLVVLINTVFLTQKTFADELIVSNGYIKETPPGATNSVAYFTLNNTTEKARRLIGIKGDMASLIELHNHLMKDGLMVMTKVDGLTIAAKSQVELKPGGYHVMIIGTNQPIQKNSQKMLTLVFESGHTQVITLPVIGLKEALDSTAHDKKSHSDSAHHTE